MLNFHKTKNDLSLMTKLVDEGISLLQNDKIPISDFGLLLNETWNLKKKLSDKITNDHIDKIYSKAIEAGAEGGKLLGAGSGGFLMFFVKPENRENVIETLKPLICVPIKIDDLGSRIILDERFK